MTPEALAGRIRDAANAIPDPCGLAQGLSIGMHDMGLIREIEVRALGGRWQVKVRARLTSPDCLHFVYFERELRAAASAMPEVARLDIEWDGEQDWTPESMSEAQRARLKERRAKLVHMRREAS